MSTLSITIKSLDGVFMSQKSFTFKAVAAALGAVTICAAGALSYVYVNSIVEYEVEQDETEYVSTEKNDITVRIKAIIRGKEDKEMITNGSTMYYTEALIDQVIDQNKESDATAVSVRR